ncbi:MAG: hypothetical protein WC869_01335 [Phycisphaerae bacterium]|jgi:hypothetical protein
MAEATASIEGVALTSVTINAASPDVIGSLMKRVTEEVMKLIPEDAIAKIASEVLSQGKVVTERARNSWAGDRETVRREYNLSDDAKDKFVKLVETSISKQVNEYFDDAEVKKLIAEAVRIGVQHGIEAIPAYAAKRTAERLGDAVLKYDNEPFIQNQIQGLASSLMKTQQALMARNQITNGDV